MGVIQSICAPSSLNKQPIFYPVPMYNKFLFHLTVAQQLIQLKTIGLMTLATHICGLVKRYAYSFRQLSILLNTKVRQSGKPSFCAFAALEMPKNPLQRRTPAKWGLNKKPGHSCGNCYIVWRPQRARHSSPSTFIRLFEMNGGPDRHPTPRAK